MKIWYQSGTGMGTDNRFKPYLESLNRHAKRVSRPDTVCEFHGQDKHYPMNRCKAAHNLAIHGYIRNAMLAEKQGYDAIVVNALDLGLREVREVVTIPVVGIGQATLYYSCMIAPNFAFVTTSKVQYPWFVEMAKGYGFQERMIPGGCMSFDSTQLLELWGNPKPYIEEFQKVAREVVARGATTLFAVGLYLSQWLIDQNIKEIDGATILDPLAICIKTAEEMVDLERLGTRRPRIGSYAPADKDVRAALEQEFR